jgi:hypothetical protein
VRQRFRDSHEPDGKHACWNGFELAHDDYLCNTPLTETERLSVEKTGLCASEMSGHGQNKRGEKWELPIES